MSTLLDTFTECERCQGTGIHTDKGVGGLSDVNENPCTACSGTGSFKSGKVDVTDLVTKIDAIKAMLDSPTLGMQKMSSNLDDIMVKLDV